AGDRTKRALDLVGEDPLDLVRTDPALVAPVADRLANAGSGGKAEVGLNENVLEIVERGGVELALGEDVGDAPSDTGRGARKAGAKALKPASLRLRGDARRGLGAGRGIKRVRGRRRVLRRGRRLASEPAAHDAGFLLVFVQRHRTSFKAPRPLDDSVESPSGLRFFDFALIAKNRFPLFRSALCARGRRWHTTSPH